VKKHDRNLNGFLEIEEFIACMMENEVKMTLPEMLTLALTGDINGD
jgi:hypothetical protein